MSADASKLTEGVLKIANIFERFQVAYAVIGGLAVGYLGHPRFTKDADFIVSIPQLKLPALLEQLKESGFALDVPSIMSEWTHHHMVNFSYESFRFDWLKPVLPLYQHLLEEARPVRWKGQAVRFASVEGVILLKLIAFRDRDREDIQALAAAAGESLDDNRILQEWNTIADEDDQRWKWFQGILERTRFSQSHDDLT